MYDLFTTLEAVTPQEYKQKGSGIRIEYGFHATRFGTCLIGVTERGICWLSFIGPDQEPRVELENMKHYWHNSVFHENQNLTEAFVQQVFQEEALSKKLHVLVKGTNFQVKVWEALLRVPAGSLHDLPGYSTPDR